MEVRHEIPLLNGYDYEFLPNQSPFRKGPISLLNSSIYSLISRKNFDAVLIYGYYYSTCWLAICAARSVGIPILFRGEGESILPRRLWKKLIRRFFLPWLYRYIDAFLVLGEGNRQHYLEYGVSEKKLFSSPQTVDQDFFMKGPNKSDSSQLRSTIGFNNNTVLFVYTSKHRIEKRPLDAIKAMCSLPPEVDAGLLMLGDGPLRQEAEEYARIYDTRRRIRFLGYCTLPKMRDYMKISDVLLLPSIENFGTSLHQGIASELAILCSDQVVAWLDVVYPGINGLVYRAGWLDALTAHMYALGNDRKLVEYLKKGSKKIKSRFSLEISINGIVEAMQYSKKIIMN
jgi:glycosyltransferase involved in cell wall biosynthesis